MKIIKLLLKPLILKTAIFSIQSPPQISQYATPEKIRIVQRLDYSNLKTGLYQIELPYTIYTDDEFGNRTIPLVVNHVTINQNFSGFVEWFVVWIENNANYTAAYVYDHYSAHDRSIFIGQPKEGKTALDRDYALVFSTEYYKTVPAPVFNPDETEDKETKNMNQQEMDSKMRSNVKQIQNDSDDDNQTEAGEYNIEHNNTDHNNTDHNNIGKESSMGDDKQEPADDSKSGRDVVRESLYADDDADDDSDYNGRTASADNQNQQNQSADSNTQDKQT